jgi:hypothetical protein
VPEGYDGHVTFYVEVDDVGQALGKVEELGGKKMMGPDQVPEGPVIGLFVDPQGHTIGLVGGGRGSDRAESASEGDTERDGGSESGDTEREAGTESDGGSESGRGE